MRHTITTLLIATKAAKWTDQTVMQYTRADMLEIFESHERDALRIGQSVTRTDKYGVTATYTDLVAFHDAKA